MFFNRRGFSMVQVMVAAGLMGVVALGTMRVLDMQTKGSRKTHQDFILNQAMNEINMLLANKAACEQSFMDVDGILTNSKIDITIKNQNGQNRFWKGQKIENKVFVKELYVDLDNKIADGSDWIGEFRVTAIFERLTSQAAEKTSAPRVMKAKGRISNGVVVSCISYETTAIESGIKEVENNIKEIIVTNNTEHVLEGIAGSDVFIDILGGGPNSPGTLIQNETFVQNLANNPTFVNTIAKNPTFVKALVNSPVFVEALFSSQEFTDEASQLNCKNVNRYDSSDQGQEPQDGSDRAPDNYCNGAELSHRFTHKCSKSTNSQKRSWCESHVKWMCASQKAVYVKSSDPSGHGNDCKITCKCVE